MSGFILKLIAAATMLIDHAGLLLFPQADWMRAVGRLAMPLFAFCIAEGFRYTRSRGKYLLRLLILGAACQIVYLVAAGDTLLGILITFSISILLMWLADAVKRAFLEKKANRRCLAASMIAAVAAVLVLTEFCEIDYGFFGILLPVCISLFSDRWMRLCGAAVGLLALCLASGWGMQWWSLCTLPILAMYNGKPGRVRMKYFFYIFYPLHLALLQLIAWVM